MSTTRLSAEQYLQYFDDDGAALIAAATDLDAAVPGCPGWNVRDLVVHLIRVYRHKTLVIDTNSPGPKRDENWGMIGEDDDALAVLAAEHAAIRERLSARPSDTATWAWWSPDQTLGFWQRRMAQETAVHRWDVESATRGIAGTSAIATPLADDGIDELLGWITKPWDEKPQPEADGHTVMVATAAHSWTVSFHPTSVHVTPEGSDAQAAITGEASDVLLYLWGRPASGSVESSGDLLALDLLRARIAEIA